MALDPNACGSSVTFEELLHSAIGQDANGIPFLRMVLVTDTGDDYFTCGADKSFNAGQLFATDSNDKIALRVSIDGI